MYNANRTIFLSLQQHSIQINTSGKIIDSFSIDNFILKYFYERGAPKKI